MISSKLSSEILSGIAPKSSLEVPPPILPEISAVFSQEMLRGISLGNH